MTDWKLVFAGGAIGILGMGAGAWLFGSRPVEAQAQAPFTQCIIARQESLDTNNQGNVEMPHVDHVINIPPGWVPVGGGGLRGDGPVSAVILCR